MNAQIRRLPAIAARLPLVARTWALPMLLLVLVAVVYWPGLGGGFVFDDFPNIVDNLPLRIQPGSGLLAWWAAIFSSPSSELQRPLAMLSFAINFALTGLDPYWMKLTNLGIHLVNTLLVFGLVRALLRTADGDRVGDARRSSAALWIAAAWALNPINLMAVLFVVQRMESLCHTFVFAGLWLYVVGRQQVCDHRRGWPLMLGGLIGGTTLGVLVKESAALLPLYALAIEWALFGFKDRASTRSMGLVAMFAAIVMAPAAVALAWQLPKLLDPNAYAGRTFSMGERLLTECRVLVDYLHWTLLPNLSQLSLYHDDYPVSRGLLAPPSTLIAILALGGLVAASFWLRQRRPLIALGLAWFFIAHLLTGTVLPLELVYEHRNYFASLGICLALGDGLLRMPAASSHRRVGTVIALALLILYGGLTTLRALEWHSQLSFSISEATKHPQSPRATYDRARTLIILSNYEPDSPYTAQARAALEDAMAAPDATPLTESAAILFASRTQAVIRPQWWTAMQTKLRSQPIGPQQTGSLSSLVDCEMQHRCQLPQQDMVATFLAALERGPNPEVFNIYGNYALNVLHDPALALRLWEAAANGAPNVMQYQQTMARMMIASGRIDAARPYIDKVRHLGRLGQNESLARELEQLSARSQSARPEDTPRPQPARLAP